MAKAYISNGNIDEKAGDWASALERRRGNRALKLDPSGSALVVIDMQNYFLDEGSHAFLPAAGVIVPNLKRLLEAYRGAGLPVIFTRHAHPKGEDPGMLGRWWNDVMLDGTPETEIAEELKPERGEVVLRKTRYSAFQRTDLEQILRSKGVRSLVVTGVMTHLCCESTAREAFMKDFEVYFVIDSTASQDEELHLSSLRTLSDGFAVPMRTRDVLELLEGTG